ncbi:hypothetical protein [Noviherbaspirillum galbum]|uniref:Formate dehydrogenase n=1 Tax=Noviherbaspirillum galbum TaxID=2709383 RepID=A0A6B3SXH2_9BURK|nr:hypothetical protein [Noviherbaspirillum galbum]NEX63202.1 hypothetical protein [Noviherbaspirillum galbum]
MAEKMKTARRSFFTGLGLVAAAGVAAKITSKTTVPQIADLAPEAADPGDDGYRLTEHIQKYYRTTKI